MYITSDLGVVTTVPGVKLNTILDVSVPSFFNEVDFSAMNDFPPLAATAPLTKSSWPPVAL
jgi:hypothetical protein